MGVCCPNPTRLRLWSVLGRIRLRLSAPCRCRRRESTGGCRGGGCGSGGEWRGFELGLVLKGRRWKFEVCRRREERERGWMMEVVVVLEREAFYCRKIDGEETNGGDGE